MSRITRKDLDNVVTRMNLVAKDGLFHVSAAYGGYRVEYTASHSSVFRMGYRSARAEYDACHAYLEAMEKAFMVVDRMQDDTATLRAIKEATRQNLVAAFTR